MTAAGEQTWTLELHKWSFYYTSPARLETLQGSYQELLAPFARAGEADFDIDAFGQISFQSAATGCAGDGRAEVHTDGSFDVYDVMLTITGCAGSYAYLNSDYQGLAVWTQGSYWNYDAYLVTFLVAPEGPPPRPALVMRGYPIYPNATL